MIDWKKEAPLIYNEAAKWSVDPVFIKAIRHTENGSAGREFGVLDEGANTYDEQLRLACKTVAHRIATYTANPLSRTANGRVRYNASWIAHFAQIWAPVRNATNDPTKLNENWYPNCCAFYTENLPA